MVSEADMRGARELCPRRSCGWRPTWSTSPRSSPSQERTTEPAAIFVANFAYAPNRSALEFLLEEVFPRVWAQLPEARLALVGAGLEHPPSEDPRVRALGFVEDLAGVYAQARCAVVPLLQGGGSPLKLIEALAYGLPVIATPRAVAGLDVHDGVDCLVAEGGAGVRRRARQVLRDGAPEIARAGRRLAEERYSIEALAALLRSLSTHAAR